MAVVRQRAMTAREWGLLGLLSLLWGGSFFFVGVAVREIPPLTLVALRVGFAAALLWAAAPILGLALPRSAKPLAALAVLGFGNNALPFALIAWGQTHLPSGLASILNAATPLFSVIAAHLLTREEKLSPLKLLGAVAGMTGVASLVGPISSPARLRISGRSSRCSPRLSHMRSPPFSPVACVLSVLSRPMSPPGRRPPRPSFSRPSRSRSIGPGRSPCPARLRSCQSWP
jgi:drug/metabolite transporter (DMT)-like permease